MKLLGVSALIGTSHAIGYTNVKDQHERSEVSREIKWVTERRIVPELVSHDETESGEAEDNYKGMYWMERPHVNFWLDFNNPVLINFRQHSNKYQSARNMLSNPRNLYGAKKSGSSSDDAYEAARREQYAAYSSENNERYTRPTRNHLLRRMASIENMVQYKTTDVAYKKPFGSYFDYGCHCFPGSFIDPRRSPHAPPQDAIDSACQAHQWAYDCAKDDYGQDCRGKYQLYKWAGTVDDDGVSTSVECLDPVDSCAWAICEIDRHLAETLAEMVRSYNPAYLVSNGFNRAEICQHKEMTEVLRANVNNNVHVQDEPEAQISTFMAPGRPSANTGTNAGSNWASLGNNMASLGTIEHNEDKPESLGRNSPGTPAEPAESGAQTGKQSPYAPGEGATPDWSKIDLSDRSFWTDMGWVIPEDEEEKKTSTSSGNGNWQDPFVGFTYGKATPDSKTEQPAEKATYTHQTQAKPETEDKLDNALDKVATTVKPMPDTEAAKLNPLMADDASGLPEGAASPASNSATSENKNVPAVVMKSATTFNHKQCCGEYPKRYKYSRNKQGCCIENAGIYASKWGYLYAPSKGQCCHKSVDSQRGTKTYTKFATLDLDCNDVMEDIE